MLTLENVSKSFGRVKAVESLSFSISQGEVVGFLGPNGAGKTTTMRIIAGVLEPDAGVVSFDGKDAIEDPMALKERLGFLPENNPLPEDLLVIQALSYFAALHGVKRRAQRQAVERAIELTSLGEVWRRPVGELSKGYRQRVGLAQAIVGDPDLLIFDEPTEGLDPNQRHEIRELIKRLGRERTVLLSTHVLTEVAMTCSRVIVIRAGRIVADGTVDELERRASGEKRTVVEGEGRGMREALEGLKGVTRVETGEGSAQHTFQRFHVVTPRDVDVRSLVFQLAVTHGWTLVELYEEEKSLEEVFRELTIEQ
ncbi:MAG: ATP-binding cassette domain-containing protein [Patescibacteria group bacterium]